MVKVSIRTDDNLNCNYGYNLHVGCDWAAHTELVDREAAHNIVDVVDDGAEAEEVAGNAEEAGDQGRWNTSFYFTQELLVCFTSGIICLSITMRI